MDGVQDGIENAINAYCLLRSFKVKLAAVADGRLFWDLPPEALLTAPDVSNWLKVAPRQVQPLEVPWIDLGRKSRRYQVKDTLSWLETRRREG